MADNDFGKMLLAEIRRHHAKIERMRAAYQRGLDEQDLSGQDLSGLDLDEAPPAPTTRRFRVIDGGKADGGARLVLR